MANIFSRIGSRIGRLFGRKERADIEAAEYARVKAQRDAEVAKARAVAAKRLADEMAEQARVLGSPRARAAGAQRAKQQVEERKRQLEIEAQRQKRVAAEQERRAREAEKKAEAELRRVEQLRAKARQALLLTRKNMSDEDFARSFRGPRPAKREYENVKTGEGDLPDKEAFLKLGVRYSAFASSNIQAMQFDPRTGDFYLQNIKKNRWYRYRGPGVKVAELMYVAASKGVASWDELRIRGTLKGSRYTVDRDVSPPDYLPLDETSSGAMFGAYGGF